MDGEGMAGMRDELEAGMRDEVEWMRSDRVRREEESMINGSRPRVSYLFFKKNILLSIFLPILSFFFVLNELYVFP